MRKVPERLDYYSTDKKVVDTLLELNIIKKEHTILEPCAGTGELIWAIKQYFSPNSPYIQAVEIQKDFYQNLIESTADEIIMDDFFKLNPDDNQFDIVVTNPPFSRLGKWVEWCHRFVKENGKLIFLIPLAYLATKGRWQMWQKYVPTDIYLLTERPKFHATPFNAEFCWVVWDNPITYYPTSLHWIPPS